MSAKPSLAFLLREWIDKKIKSKYDYSTATGRKQDVLDFIAANKDKLNKDQDFAKVRSSHSPILNEMLEKNGIDPKSIGKQKKGKKSLHYSNDMNKGSTITPAPQAGDVDTTPKPATPQAGGEQLTQPIPAQPIQAYSVEAVSATFSAFFLTLKAAIPEMEMLTDDEKIALGEMWQPAFNLYLQNEKLAVIGIPILSTLGMFIPKMLEGRKKGKIKKSKEEGLERQKEIDLKNERKQKELEEQKIKAGEKQPPQDPEKPVIGESSSEIKVPEKPTLPKEE